MELHTSLKLPELGLFPREFSAQQADLFHLFFSFLSKQLFLALSNCVISWWNHCCIFLNKNTTTTKKQLILSFGVPQDQNIVLHNAENSFCACCFSLLQVCWLILASPVLHSLHEKKQNRELVFSFFFAFCFFGLWKIGPWCPVVPTMSAQQLREKRGYYWTCTLDEKRHWNLMRVEQIDLPSGI